MSQDNKAQDFSKAAKTYRENAIVQRQMAKKLACLVFDFCGGNFEKILEIGAGTGFLTENTVKTFAYGKLILNDITDNFTGFSDCEYIKGDACRVEFPDDCNLIISNACFQWFLDIGAFLDKIQKNLAKDGVLAFSSFGEQNCRQFSEIEHTGLKYPNYKKILEKRNWEILAYEEEIQTLYFSSPLKVLRHIKSTGVMISDNKVWNKGRLKIFEECYARKFCDGNGFELTYNPLYIVAKPR